MNRDAVRIIVQDVREQPCTKDKCKNIDICSSKKVACRAFYNYITSETAKIQESKNKFRGVEVPKDKMYTPTEAFYSLIYTKKEQA